MKPKDDFEFGDLAEPDDEARGQSSAAATSPDEEGLAAGPADPPPLRLLDDHLLTPGGTVGAPHRDAGPGFGDDAFAPASGEGDDSPREESDRRRRPPGILPVSDPRVLEPTSGRESASGRKPGTPGGESARTGIRKTDNEENVYVLLEDKPDQPSGASYLPPVEPPPPDLDPDAPLSATAPDPSGAAIHDPLKATESLDEAGVFEAAGAGERSGSHGAAAAAARALDEKVAEDLDEEPEFLYPKQPVASAISGKLAPPRKTGLSRPARALLFVGLAAGLGFGAMYAVRTFLGDPSAGVAGNGSGTSQSGQQSSGQKPPPGSTLSGKLRRGLDWGLPPAGSKPAGPAGSATPGSEKR